MDQGLGDRLFNFALSSLKFLGTLPKLPETSIIRFQLAKSSTSSGANYEEAQAGSSKADFHNKVRISLKEMRESNYWLRTIKALLSGDTFTNEIDYIIDESFQLRNILGSIVTKTNLIRLKK